MHLPATSSNEILTAFRISVAAESLIALQIEGTRRRILSILRISFFSLLIFFFLLRTSYNSPLPDSIRRFISADLSLSDYTKRISNSHGKKELLLPAPRFTAQLLLLDAEKFSATIFSPGSSFSFRFFSWNMYNVYNRSFVSKVGNLPRTRAPRDGAADFSSPAFSRCFFPFRLLPRLRDFI